MTNPLFSLWETERIMPLYDLLQALPPDEAYALMTDLHAAERRALLGPMHARSEDWVRPRIALAPLLVERYDIDVLAAQFADYVFELNLDSAFLMLLTAQPEKLAEVVDMGNFDVLEAAVAGERPVLVTPLHYGPVYASLGLLAGHFPITTMYHDIPLDELREQWAPSLDLEGIRVPAPGALLRCLETFRAGRVLSILPEYDPKGAGPLHVPLSFMGATIAATTGPAMIAQRAGALMIPYFFSSPSPGRFEFRFESPIEPGEGVADRVGATERIFRLLEAALLAGEPGKWELWADFERLADKAWLEARQQRAAA
jgi:phosphatidylinositol dimannoside acyltransferase